MKLLILSDSAAPHTRRWANWFAANGLEVHVVTFNNQFDSGYAGVKVHPLWVGEVPTKLLSRLTRSIKILFRLNALVKEICPDIVHSHSMGSYAWSATLLNLKPRIVTPWGTDLLIDIKASLSNKILTMISLRSADLVTTDAEYFGEKLIALGVKKSNLILVQFGTDVSLFKPKAEMSTSSMLTIVSTRTLNPVHRVEDLMDIIPDLLKSYSSIRFVIVGGGINLESFSDQITKHGLQERVTFTGMLGEKDLIDVLQNSDIYVSTSPLDAGLAASTAEAMACSLPIIHPDVAENRLWADETRGAIFQANDKSELKSAIEKLIKCSQNERVEMGERNRETIVSRNNLDVNMAYMQTAYQKLLQDKS
jgi:glycosyltransferase involved in cell wall biosynthesis